MKLLALLTLVGFCTCQASVKAQNSKITLSATDASLASVFRQIEQLTDYMFIYKSSDVAPYSGITVNRKKTEVKYILDECLAHTGLSYTFKDNLIIIQNKTQQSEKKIIKGKVTDTKGLPLPGVTVLLKGTTMGVVTNAQGEYQLSLPDAKDLRLLFSFIGMKAQEVAYSGQETINITLHAEVMEMEEVVVTGYQVVDKRKNTSSVKSLNMDDISVVGATSLDQMLEGRVPDMILMTTSGEVGVAPKIRIRGTSTLIGNREPLWVVDGIIVQDPVPISTEELNDPDYVNRIGNAIAGLNPQDIDRIDVLKDAAATALYGTKAANGVIVVTTKKGRIGKPLITYNMSTTFRQRPRYSDRKINLMNSKERIQFSRELNEQHFVFNGINYVGYEGLLKNLYEGKINNQQFAEQVAKLETINTDWFDLLTEDSWSHQHTVSMAGGSEQTRYYASIGYTRDNDVIKNNYNQRYTASLNVESTLAKWMTASFQLQGNVSTRSYTPDAIAPLDYAYKTSRAIPAYEENGEYYYYQKRTGDREYNYNILNELENSDKEQNTSGITLTTNLKFDFTSWLNANAIISYTNQNAEIESYYGEKTNYVARLRDSEFGELPSQYSYLPFGGELKHDETRNKAYTVRLQLNANKYFGINTQHNLAFSGGFEMNSTKYNGYMRTERGYYPDRGKLFVALQDREKYPNYVAWLTGEENLPTLTENLTNMLSGYATLSYSYHNYFTANVNARIDGSNKFGDQSNNKLLPIWSASANWNLTEHEWMKYDWLNYLSIKTSFGYQGNMLDNQSPVMIIKKLPLNSYLNEMVAQVERNPNPNLKWEKTSSYNIGLTMALLNNRLQVEAEYYYKRTKDAFMTKEVSSINGVKSYVINGGDIENKGYNVDLTITPIRTNDWRWTLSTSFSQNFNTVKNDPSAQTYDYYSFLNGTAIVKGKAVNTFYSYDFIGVSPNDGGPLFNDLIDQKHELYGLSKYQTFTRVLKATGRREPYMSGGLSTQLRYKQLRMNAMFAYSLGAKTRLFRMYDKDLSPENNVHRSFINRWRQPGDEQYTNIPALISQSETAAYWRYQYHWSDDNSSEEDDGANSTIQRFANNAWEMYDYSDERVVSANYLKLSSLRFTYEFGERLLSKMKLSRLELSLSGTNLFTICSKKLDGQTPTQGGFSEIQLSDRPTYSFGLTVSF